MGNRMKQVKPIRDTSTDLDVRSVFIEAWNYNGRFTQITMWLGDSMDAKRYLTKVSPGVAFCGLLSSGLIPNSSYVWVNKEGAERYFTDVKGQEIAELDFDDAWQYITKAIDGRLAVRSSTTHKDSGRTGEAQ